MQPMRAFLGPRIGRIRGLIVSFRQRRCDERDCLGWGSNAVGFRAGSLCGEAGRRAPRRAVFCRPCAGRLDHSSARTSPCPPAGDRDATRQRCVARHEVEFEAPALLWLPADLEGDLQVEAGAQGYLIAISEDFLTKTVAGSAEALHLRRTIDRLVLLKAGQVEQTFQRRRPLLRHAGARSSFSRPRHHDDDVIARAAALPASVAFGASQANPPTMPRAGRRPKAGRKFPADGRTALSRWLAGRALCGRAGCDRRQASRALQARERRSAHAPSFMRG